MIFAALTSSIADSLDKEHELLSRAIGHNILLNFGDSTSRVLPIAKNGNEYVISFETEFGFVPDDLVRTVDSLLRVHANTKKYLVQVIECQSEEVVYSYSRDTEKQNEIVPCDQRVMPKSCYQIGFTIQDEQVESRPQNLLLILVLFVPLLLLALWWFNKKSKGSKKGIQIGAFRYNQNGSYLFLEGVEIALTSKENDLFAALLNQKEETVRKEELMESIWEDRGSYEGRTLDVYISRLRKKLEADSSIKIVNIKGIGYKLSVEA